MCRVIRRGGGSVLFFFFSCYIYLADQQGLSILYSSNLLPFSMKHAFTRLLPVAAGLLFCVPAAQAQVAPSPSVSKAPKALPTLPQVSVPAGASSLRHQMPTVGVGPTKRLAQQRALARSGSKQATLAGAAQSQARTSTTENAQQVWVTRYQGAAGPI